MNDVIVSLLLNIIGGIAVSLFGDLSKRVCICLIVLSSFLLPGYMINRRLNEWVADLEWFEKFNKNRGYSSIWLYQWTFSFIFKTIILRYFKQNINDKMLTLFKLAYIYMMFSPIFLPIEYFSQAPEQRIIGPEYVASFVFTCGIYASLYDFYRKGGFSNKSMGQSWADFFDCLWSTYEVEPAKKRKVKSVE